MTPFLLLRRRAVHSSHRRAFSTAGQIYVSSSTNPYFNLSLEDTLFRKCPPQKPLLLLYRDAPCVVIGRNQSPWAEVNIPALKQAGLQWIRRRSGGGAVFHDLGNVNFSIHTPRTGFDRQRSGQMVARAVRSLGVDDANVNERNDVVVGQRKVSGSAYKIVSQRAYHHGTMLLSSKLDTLGDVLRPKKEGLMKTKGVQSVRSPVVNLSTIVPGLDHEAFIRAVVSEFRSEYDVEVNEEVHIIHETPETLAHEEIANGMAELPSWEWAYGQTPEFTYELSRSFSFGTVKVEITSKHGVINACDIALDSDSSDKSLQHRLDGLAQALVGQRYAFLDHSALRLPSAPGLTDEYTGVLEWLEGEMVE